MTEKVVLCDLRPHRQAHEAAEEVSRLLADQDKPDLRLLLVLDTPLAVTEHALAYEELWRSRRVEKLLEVLVGPLVIPGSLEVPGSIGTDHDSGIIWVGDSAGVDWQLSASTIENAHPAENGESGLSALLEILSAPQVFARILELVAAIPGRVASPGLRVFELTANQTMFLAALSRGIAQLLDADAADAPVSIAVVSDAARIPATVASTVVPGSRLASARDRCTDEAAEFAETAEALGTAAALYGADRLGPRARNLAVRTGTELREYRTAAQVLVGTPAAERASRLRDWGVRPAASQAAGPDDIAATITAALEADAPLPALSLRLRDYERELRARGDAPTAEQIEQACPRALENRLVAPEPMAGPQPWLIATGAVAIALTALGPTFGIIAGLVTALAWLGLLGLTVARGPGGRLADHRGSLAASGVAAAAGLAVGITIARALRPPDVLAEAGIVIGLAATLVTVTWSWRVRVRRWCDALRVGEVVKAASSLTEIVVTAATRAWSADATRQDALIRAKAALDGVTAALLTYQRKLDSALSRSPVRPRTRRELEAFVRHGLSLLVLEALRPVLSALTSSSPQEHEQSARTQTEDLLRRWDKYVDDGRSPLEFPDFINGEAMRSDALGDDDIASIKETITAEPREVMWQLCRAHDISLLDPVASRLPALRFAPRAALPSISSALPFHAEWVSSTRRAGILRLVPVRHGVVRRTWSTGSEAADEGLVGDGWEGGNLTDGQART